MEFAKQFFRLLEWTRVKASLILSIKTFYPKTMEIWWASLGFNIGVEVNGKNENFERPVLVINVINQGSILIVPLTTKVKDNRYIVPITSIDTEYSALNVSQTRSISTKRLLRKKTELSLPEFQVAVSAVQQILFTKNTPTSGISLGTTVVNP